MGLGGVISNLLSLGAKLLPAVVASAQAPSSSSSSPADQNHQIKAELDKLMRMLERIKATLYDAEQREIIDFSVKLWLKELKGVAYDAQDVLDEYHYEVLRAQVETRDAFPPDSRKRKLIQVPYSMLDHIQHIRSRFDEIANHRLALQLSESDGPNRCNNKLQIAPTSHIVVDSNIFGREREKEKLIDLMCSECDVPSVVTIVGMGGIGKTTLAQLVYNDYRIRQRFDKFGWICVSDDFNVERLTKELVESITGNECGLTNLSAWQEKIRREISGKRVLLVLDDVWNEKKSLWDSFQAPFMSATFVKILVTTRNDPVARIMQTEPTFNLSCLSDEQCWQLFEHYAFGGVDQNKNPRLVEIGKQIMNKCGMLPLAVKSIGSLLRHEAEEESWRDILESELWESDVSNDIFPPLQISYARLPTYLKSCFLYCSMFPKDHHYDVEYLVKLWMYQGYIDSNGNKTIEKIGFEYAQVLCHRSLFEREYESNDFVCLEFKLHDIVHDLARHNLENSCFSIEVSKLPIFPNVMHHLYIDDLVYLKDPVPSDKLTALRTLIIGSTVQNFFTTFDLSMAPKLRALEMEYIDCELETFSSIGNLKHLRYLSLSNILFEMLPECICSLYNLQNLTLKWNHLKELPTKIRNLISLEELIIVDDWFDLKVLPDSLCQLKALRKLYIVCPELNGLPNNIGGLVSLEELQIKYCHGLRVLPVSLCQLKALRKLCLIECELLEELPNDMGRLTNLQTLEIRDTGVSCLPPSLSKFVGILALNVMLKCKIIGWLKDLPDLSGTLYLFGLKNISNLMDVQCANLMSIRNLEHLVLDWNEYNYQDIDDSVLKLTINSDQSLFLEEQSCFSVMVSLQPHPKLAKLQIKGYNGITFPEWIGSLCKLKYLKITSCNSLLFLKAESLPLELEELEICQCHQLVSMPGIQNLKSLAKLSIDYCENLCSFMEPSLELTMRVGVGSYGSSLLGLTNLASLRSLEISACFKLQVLVDELLPAQPCKIAVYNCPGLREWCLQQGINYEIDNLVAQAIKQKEISKKGYQEIESFIGFLSGMYSSLKPWFARLQEALTSTTTVTSKNQIKTHSTPFPVKGKLPSKTDTPQQNLTISQSLANTSTMSLKTQIKNHTTPYHYKRPQQSLTSKTDSMQLDLLVSPSPLVPFRGDSCMVIDGGKQLFLLTPMQKSRFEVPKAAPPTKTLLPDTSTVKTHETHGKDGVPITESISKVRFSNTVLLTKPLPNIPVTCTRKNCEKDVKDRVPLAEPVHEAGFYGLSKSVPNVSVGKMHEKFGGPISKPVHDLKVINQKKEVSGTLDWFFSPPKTCVLMEPSDQQRPSNWKNLKEPSTPVDKNKRYGDSCEKNWNNLYMSATCTKKGETTLKRELWTRFEAVSTCDLGLNTDIFQDEDGKGFMDLLDEASS